MNCIRGCAHRAHLTTPCPYHALPSAQVQSFLSISTYGDMLVICIPTHRDGNSIKPGRTESKEAETNPDIPTGLGRGSHALMSGPLTWLVSTQVQDRQGCSSTRVPVPTLVWISETRSWVQKAHRMTRSGMRMKEVVCLLSAPRTFGAFWGLC